MKVIGLTGGIGTGKTTVATMLKELGATIIDTDKIARRIVEPGRPALTLIVKEFGENLLLPDGNLNRQLLGDVIFKSDYKRQRLNEITHPAIKEEVEKELNQLAKKNSTSVVAIEAPLLIEAAMTPMVDEIWVVTVKKDIQVKRVMERDGLSFEKTMERIESQMPPEERLTYADVVISTEGSLNEIKKQVKLALLRLAGDY